MDPSPDRDLVSAQRQGTSLHISRFLCCRMFDQCQTVRARNMAATRAWRRRRDSRSDYGGQGRGFHREGIGTFIADKMEGEWSAQSAKGRQCAALYVLPNIWLPVIAIDLLARSEERRVGKENVSTCRSRWSPEH